MREEAFLPLIVMLLLSSGKYQNKRSVVSKAGKLCPLEIFI